ncbi:hypothetical protein K438DRAFT_1984052 [Mycena galopus ATCC 62051]|nr:hypothetical protein K438DRAFT_1984052 [Mycena galopus ATCC 62051]
MQAADTLSLTNRLKYTGIRSADIADIAHLSRSTVTGILADVVFDLGSAAHVSVVMMDLTKAHAVHIIFYYPVDSGNSANRSCFGSATQSTVRGDFVASARNVENWLPGLLEPTDGWEMDSISPTGLVLSGTPMHDAYLNGMADLDWPQHMTVVALTGGSLPHAETSLERSVRTRWTPTERPWARAKSQLLAPFVPRVCFTGTSNDDRKSRRSIRNGPHPPGHDRHPNLACGDSLPGPFVHLGSLLDVGA